MKYLFLAGAPGSKWSSVAKNLYTSDSFDTTDQSADREYYHSAWGEPLLMHMGAYFDPGMEFGNRFDHMSKYTKAELEAELDRPFSGTGVRLIKSHVFCHHLDFIRYTWPDCAIVLVHRPDDACLGWWVRCGHFNITYPVYDYYKDLKHMAQHIDNQNTDLLKFSIRAGQIADNKMLCAVLNISEPASYQDYRSSDVRVYVDYQNAA